MTFGEKLQSLRQRAGMSQDALAERLQVSRQAVSRWERDETMPETDKVVALADIFGVTTDYLLRLQPEQTEPEEKQPPPQERKDWVERFLAFSKLEVVPAGMGADRLGRIGSGAAGAVLSGVPGDAGRIHGSDRLGYGGDGRSESA